MTELPHQAAFAARNDLEQFGANARLLFALETRFRLDDVHTVAADALTDGSNDKKCDLVYIDRESEVVIVAQGYESSKEKLEAPANKAADLNTAVAWLLSRPLAELPEDLRAAAEDVRTALASGDINSLQAWYVHNLPESKNVADELKSVENSLLNAVATCYPNANVRECSSIEVGRNTLEDWYQGLQAPILVADPLDVIVDGFYEVVGDNWSAAVTAVPARWLHQIWQDHASMLFSANVRDYLGSRRSTANVNNGIKTSATQHPGQFFVFNNGITALVNDFSAGQTASGGKVRLTLSGLSIVNGAQTTGSIGSLDLAPSEDALVQARFVKCADHETIQDIIRFTNTQNAVKATDFRSNDSIQRRLRDEFNQIPNAKYLGGRRGGSEDVIKRSANLLPTDTCSQAMVAFHQDPALAYTRKSQIWQSDGTYSKYFSDGTHADHIVFCYALLRATEALKRDLQEAATRNEALTQDDTALLSFFRKRGATFLFVAAIGACVEVILGRPVPNIFRLSFGPKTSPDLAQTNWKPILEALSSFASDLADALDGGLTSRERVRPALEQFRKMARATRSANAALFGTFASKVVERSGEGG